jgi:hypothetical protein
MLFWAARTASLIYLGSNPCFMGAGP